MADLPKMRQHVCEKFGELFEDKTIGKELDACILNYAHDESEQSSWDDPKFRALYKSKFIMLMSNLTNPNNPRLFERVCSGEIKLETLVKMTHDEMFPEHWEKVHKRHQDEMDKLAPKLDETVKSVFKCVKCKKYTVNYFELQTRSADEPMTAFFNCLSCGHRWKR